MAAQMEHACNGVDVSQGALVCACETWPPFRRRHFQAHYDSIFTGICS